MHAALNLFFFWRVVKEKKEWCSLLVPVGLRAVILVREVSARCQVEAFLFSLESCVVYIYVGQIALTRRTK